jgi:hypothetical protein
LNFELRLRAIAPVIMEHGVRYEQGKYEEKMYTDEAVKVLELCINFN